MRNEQRMNKLRSMNKLVFATVLIILLFVPVPIWQTRQPFLYLLGILAVAVMFAIGVGKKKEIKKERRK
jgi:hypothetical protein